MKFKDKDGRVYRNIFSAWIAWTCPNTMCRERPGDGECEFRDTVCMSKWCELHPAEAAHLMGYEIVEPAPCFTEEEVADARVLARALLATGFKRNRYEDIYAISECAKDILLDSSMFPSILPGQTVKLSDILGRQ